MLTRPPRCMETQTEREKDNHSLIKDIDLICPLTPPKIEYSDGPHGTPKRAKRWMEQGGKKRRAKESTHRAKYIFNYSATNWATKQPQKHCCEAVRAVHTLCFSTDPHKYRTRGHRGNTAVRGAWVGAQRLNGQTLLAALLHSGFAAFTHQASAAQASQALLEK